MRSLALLVLLAAAPLGGCINTDAAVFVAPNIAEPQVTVTSNLLGTSVSGAFQLQLHLGARASGPSSVALVEFDLLDANGKVLVSPLTLTSSPMSPVAVQPDSDVDVTVSFDTGAKLLGTDVGMALCSPPISVKVGGRIQDSLQDTSTPVSSAALTVTCN